MRRATTRTRGERGLVLWLTAAAPFLLAASRVSQRTIVLVVGTRHVRVGAFREKKPYRMETEAVPSITASRTTSARPLAAFMLAGSVARSCSMTMPRRARLSFDHRVN